MQKDTLRILASQALMHVVRDLGKENTDEVALGEYIASELPGLDSDASEEIVTLAMKLLPYVEVHVEVAHWRLEEHEYQEAHNAQPKEPGAVW